MDVQQELKRVIGQPIATPRDADRVHRAAELLAEHLRLEQSARELIEQSANADRGRDDLRGMSLHDAAERVLEDAGTPLHVKELGSRLKARGWRHPRSSNAHPERINFQLAARLPKHPDRFRRVAPNTFGLVKWDSDGAVRKARRPRTGLFSGTGQAVGRSIGETTEPLDDEAASWRSS
jgi:hypothetical protein